MPARRSKPLGAILPSAAVLVGTLVLAGCRSSFDLALADARARSLEARDARAPREERLVVRDPVTKVVREERRFLSIDGDVALQLGIQRTWYDGGEPETLRSFDEDGNPLGVWWSWWRTGALRSAYVFDPTKATRMTWWHANGLPASDGLARTGSRTGTWRFWHENGELESEGEFVGGKRHGPWTYYDEAGEWTERGTFVGGVRQLGWERRGGG